MTGLHNRRAFVTLGDQQLKVAYRTKRSMAVLFIDLDNMKLINDAFGHEEGDFALKEIGNVLRESFRESDLIARIGGDEFAIMALEVPIDSTEILIRRLREKTEAHNAAMGKPYHLSISVGVARYAPECPCPIEELLSQADASMYEEKNTKKILGLARFLKTSK
jgi:diguanylate cyclase (GGDEF)-like protein